MQALERMRAWWRGKDSPPIINDNDGNRPSITIRRSAGGGRYYPYSDGYTGNPWAGYGDQDYARRSEAGYKRNSDVYACVSLIGNAAKQVKWWDGSGASKSAAEMLMASIRIAGKYSKPADPAHHKYWQTKVTRPNPLASIVALERAGGAAFIEQWISYLLLAGDTFIEKERDARGQLKMLHLLQPDFVAPEINKDAIYATGAVKHWKVSTRSGGVPRIVPLENMVHSKLFNPTDDVMGMSPLQAALLRVEMQNAGMMHVRRTLERGQAPGWVQLDKDSEWDDEQLMALRRNIEASRAEAKELVLQNAQFHDTGVKPGDSGLSEGQLLTKRDIASVFHVDPALIGDTDGRTYATYRESRRGLYMEAVIPHLTQFRDDWNASIGFELESPLDFDKDSFDAITAAREEAADRVRGLFQTGLIDRNESRRDLEYEPVPGSDGVFYAPASFVPMEDGPQAKPVPVRKPA